MGHHESTALVFGQSLHRVLKEIETALSRADRTVAADFINELREAKAVYTTGAGRSGLAVASFAMRLVHLGLTAHVAGDATTPSIGPGDLLVACSGSGEKPTVLVLAETAKQTGARVVAVTAAEHSSLAWLADLVVTLPEGRGGYDSCDSEQFMGTLFEQAAYLFFDSVVLTMQKLADIETDEMRDRHTNLE
ncbi:MULTISPECIES: 6-phospho-3-hexuloisomerase [unclassified Nonomuraea]|uniref:6-phospho-3-hexuloisomerase n=1 Tax=unclassified Nonomuraea TaxID=2593643 RepID=UPI0033EA0DCE